MGKSKATRDNRRLPLIGYQPAVADTKRADAGYKRTLAYTTMPTETAATFPAQPAAAAGLDTERTIAAVAHPTRRAILFHLADGQPRAVATVATVAAAVGTMDILAGKHLILLRKVGLIETVPPPDSDGRKSYYRLRDGFLANDAAGRIVLDLGPVALRAK